jgi:hypothetical protein
MRSDAFSASSHSFLYGISIQDNHIAELEEAGADPNLKSGGPGPLHPKIARAIISYNTAPKTPAWEDLEHWLVAVGNAGLTPYITFGDENGATEFCTSQPTCKLLQPHEQKYGEDVERLIKDFKNGGGGRPPVTIWGAWNEPDLGGKKGIKKHYFAYEAKKAAKIWSYAKAAMQGAGCSGCVMVAGEFAEYKPAKPGYEEEYEKEIVAKRNEAVKIGEHSKRYPRKPSVWGLHDYHDLEYYFEHHSNSDAEGFDHELAAAVGKTRIWLSELGVFLSEGPGLEQPLETATDNGKQIMHVINGKLEAESADELQVEAAKDFLTLGTLPSVEMLDYYEYRSAGGFDSALLPPSNKEPAREAYCVLARNEPACPPGATTESVIQSATTATASTAAVKVNPNGLPTEYWLEYGKTTAYGETTASVELANSSGEQSATIALAELEACTTYHYQVEAENEANEGEPALGGDLTFTTSCPGLITAFAGDGQRNTRSGDGGEATQAGIALINGLTAAANGNVYLSEFAFNDVRRVEPDGIISDAAGFPVPGGPSYSGDGEAAPRAGLGEPFGVAADGNTIYIADEKNQVIRAVSPTGTISTFAGKRPEVNYESGSCRSRDRLYSGDGGPAIDAGFGDPSAVAVGADGSLYIADTNDDVVRKVEPDGTITTVAGYYEGSAEVTHKIYSYRGGPLACEYTSYEPSYHTLSGVAGPATSATLGQISAIAAGPEGSLYIATNNLVLKVDADGTLTVFAGTGEGGYSGDGGPASFATLDDPAGLAVGPDGSVYIADSCNAVIRRVAPDGISTTVAGTGERGEGGDGGQATEAQLEDPTTIAVGGNSDLYIGSNETGKVRKIEAPLGAGTASDIGGHTCRSEGGGGGGG